MVDSTNHSSKQPDHWQVIIVSPSLSRKVENFYLELATDRCDRMHDTNTRPRARLGTSLVTAAVLPSLVFVINICDGSLFLRVGMAKAVTLVELEHFGAYCSHDIGIKVTIRTS